MLEKLLKNWLNRFCPFLVSVLKRVKQKIAQGRILNQRITHLEKILVETDLALQKEFALRHFNLHTSSTPPHCSTKPLAMFSVLPPEKSGIANYTYETFSNAPFQVHFYHHFKSISELIEFSDLKERVTSQNWRAYHPDLFSKLNSQYYNYDKAIFVLGNSCQHRAQIKSFLSESIDCREKILYLHEVQLIGLWFDYCDLDFKKLKEFYLRFYPEHAYQIKLCQTISSLEKYTLGIRPLIAMGKASKVLVNSQEAKDLLMSELGNQYKIECDVLFHPIFPITTKYQLFRSKTDSLCLGSFGLTGPCKHPDILFKACQIVNMKKPLKLIMAGYQLKQDLRAMDLKVPKFVELVDSPSNEQLFVLMNQVDIAIQLRWPTFGEASGVISQLLNFNKPIIATDSGSFRNYSDCIKLTRIGITPDELAQTILDMDEKKDNFIQQIAKAKELYSLDAFYKKFAAALDPTGNQMELLHK